MLREAPSRKSAGCLSAYLLVGDLRVLSPEICSIASGEDLMEVATTARRSGVPDALIIRVEPNDRICRRPPLLYNDCDADDSESGTVSILFLFVRLRRTSTHARRSRELHREVLARPGRIVGHKSRLWPERIARVIERIVRENLELLRNGWDEFCSGYTG